MVIDCDSCMEWHIKQAIHDGATEDEIMELKWFKPREIPDWPDKVSIARILIDYFIEEEI